MHQPPPRAEAPPDRTADAAVPSGASPAGFSLSVLLAEDDATNQFVAERMLNRLGHRVTIVGDGAAAVAAAEQGGFDLILMDVMMPVLDGIAATRAIRALPGAPGAVPIVALTATASSHNKHLCLQAGMNGYLSKPTSAAALTAALQRVLAKQTTPMDAPALAMPQPPQGLPRFDSTVLAALADEIGWPDVDAILDVFIAETAPRLIELRRDAAAGDAAAIAHHLHALKSAAGSLGFLHLAAVAEDLAVARPQGDPARLHHISDMLDALFAASCQDTQDWRQNRPSTGSHAAGTTGSPARP